VDVKAKILCDNTVYGIGPLAEHGWSVWLETRAGNLLFDTGQGKALVHNATQFGLDLAAARMILLSHHHYDHTGGLRDALHLMRGGPDRGGVPVYAHFDLFKESYAMPKGQRPRHIGIPFSRAALEGAGARFHLANEWQQVADGIYLTGEVPRQTAFERGDPDLKHFGEDGAILPDPILDDQTLVVETRRGLFVVLGCSHAGIVNILTYIAQQTGQSHFHTVIGGTHLKPAQFERVEQTIAALLDFDIERIGVSHCTGQSAAARMASAFGDRFFYCNVGTEVEI
jgi:7,8-dihydropterin-6-yl-methyl-4-(beta-D-ribofuranosyl)aminobenzene 5'-phosphate synthase